MEEGLEFYELILNKLGLKENGIETYAPLTLAYIGDAIYEIVIRTMIISEGDTQVNKLHKRASALVKAETQSKMIKSLYEDLSEDEMKIYKRGRNAKSTSVAKNASVSDYRHATGFEALMGYLYLEDKCERAVFLTKRALEILQIEP